jgi:ribose 5-phosphate isomerase A
MSDPRDMRKREAALAAVALVEDGMVVGLGTGSTAAFAIDGLIERVRGGLRIVGIPTSERSAQQARNGGITLTDFATHPTIDLTIDGADEIHRDTLNLIKGLGGALLREKIVAVATKRLVIIADEPKLVPQLGRMTPVPVEVVQFGWETTQARLTALGAVPTLRKSADGSVFHTDGGNLILDCKFDTIADPASLEQAVGTTTGVVESGLFIGLATTVLVATETGVLRLDRSAA